jgi:hypothetical protein
MGENKKKSKGRQENPTLKKEGRVRNRETLVNLSLLERKKHNVPP